jgi:hypothetical protein
VIDVFENKCKRECDAFNKQRRKPFSLLHVAFAENVQHYLDIEKNKQDKADREMLEKDFQRFLRVVTKKWFYYPLNLWYWVTNGSKEGVLKSWRKYHVTHR